MASHTKLLTRVADDQGFDDDKFSKKYFSEELFNDKDKVTTETEESSSDSQQTSVDGPAAGSSA